MHRQMNSQLSRNFISNLPSLKLAIQIPSWCSWNLTDFPQKISFNSFQKGLHSGISQKSMAPTTWSSSKSPKISTKSFTTCFATSYIRVESSDNKERWTAVKVETSVWEIRQIQLVIGEETNELLHIDVLSTEQTDLPLLNHKPYSSKINFLLYLRLFGTRLSFAIKLVSF